MTALPTSSQHFTGHPSNCNKAKKKEKATDRKKFPLFLSIVCLYKNILREYITMTRTNNYVVKYINIYKSIKFLYTSSKILKKIKNSFMCSHI